MEDQEVSTPGRRTRSRAAKSIPNAKVEKPSSRKTRKKVVLMEVEVSEDEEDTLEDQKSAQVDESIECMKEEPLSKKRKVSVDEKEDKNGNREPRHDEISVEPKIQDSVGNRDLNGDKNSVVASEVVTKIDKAEEKLPIIVEEQPLVPLTKKTDVDKPVSKSDARQENEICKLDTMMDDEENTKVEVIAEKLVAKRQNKEKKTAADVQVKDDSAINAQVKEEQLKDHDATLEVDLEKSEREIKQSSDIKMENTVTKERRIDVKIKTSETNIEVKDEKNETIVKSDIKVGKKESLETLSVPKAEKPEIDTTRDIVKQKKGVETKATVDSDAENISEDELPGVPVVKVPEAEEVSDEELPEPKRAELPADTEVVSEDELPTVKTEKKELKKRKLDQTGYDPGSPTSENETPSKKVAADSATEKEKEEKSPKPKKLPELDKYWKAVNDDPTDFTGWTYLLQYVDQENDMEAAREAYDAFLSHYPYCYGYWRKYADYEKRKGNKKKCEEVFERGLKAIPLSVDLWLHYLTYVKGNRTGEEDYIRSQFERALAACGLEFRSDRLWDSYIKWETDGKRLQRVTGIYDKLLATPTQGYTTHFDSFQEHIASNPPNKVIEVDEFLALRKEVKHMLKHDVTSDTGAKDKEESDAPPGDEEPSKMTSSDEETKAIRERIVSIRRKAHKATVNAVTARWNYEEGIKRPYFHVKPLERCQLKNWHDYLDYETEQGDRVRIVVLFERCLIACALYEDFWLKFVFYLEGLKDPEMLPKIRDVYERACTIHHLKKPNLHLQWAIFEEGVGNIPRAAEILVNLEKSVPNILQIAYRRINLERRRSDFEKCMQLFEHYITSSKNKMVSSNIAIKYARFCLKVLKDINKAQEVLKMAISKDTNNPRLYLQLVDLTLQKENVDPSEIIEIIDSFINKDTTDSEQKVLFAQRKLEYLEDFGSDIQSVQQAYDSYQKYLKLNKENSKKKEVKSDSTTPTKNEKGATQTPTQAGSYSSYGSYSNTQQPPYTYTGTQQGQYNYSQYGQGDQYQYQNWQYPQGGYGGYNQWGGYGGGYGY